VDNGLATFTLVVLVFYAPIETWGSWPDLLSPYYLVDVVGMLILALGVYWSRARPRQARGFICAGWAWMAGAGWRATADRVEALAQGEELQFGAAELCFVVCSFLLALAGLAWSLVLITRDSHGETPPEVIQA
jgi:hypothetical protein